MLYKDNKLEKISFPLGGIGTGSIGLSGNGRLIDWEIFNKPHKGSANGFTHYSIRGIDKEGKIYTRALNGDFRNSYEGQYCKGNFQGFGFGPDSGTMCGFPHFSEQDFNGEFPIATLSFKDEKFPADVQMTAFNPFIPLDDKNSSIPAAFFEFSITNTFSEEMDFSIAFSVTNPFDNSINTFEDGMITLSNKFASNDINYGDLTIASDCEKIEYQSYWYRGQWKDSLVTFWNEFSSGKPLKDRNYEDAGNNDTATVAAEVKIESGKTEKIRFILSWNIPNNYNYWNPLKDENGNDVTWKNYYAVLFENSQHTAKYCLDNWENLFERTLLFKQALYTTTLNEKIIDRACASLSVLKSPTVLRLEDGSFYGWEGVQEQEGSCEGTCQHVWNYAYALCFLFPNLERSIRNLELQYSTYDSGEMNFRLSIPVGREKKKFRACLDGQMGTIIKIYRDWKITGDGDWLKTHWEKIKLILEYAWSDENVDEWDRNKDGVLEGRQHHTLDMEIFGPSSWLEGFYLAALKAASEMAAYLNDFEKAKEYNELYEKGYAWTKENLFNGEFFIQKIDLNDKSVTEHFDCVKDYWNEETGEIKYQIASGSEIDQMCAQWHADICGLGEIFDDVQVKTALKNMYKNNVKSTMRDFVNPWRIFSLNDEGGAVICDYPENVYKPKIPIPYCEETMTGFEYQLAGLLMSRGFACEGMKIVEYLSERFDGQKRNPWNEFECGSNYARSMAAFALIPIMSGFEFDLPNKRIGFNPKSDENTHRCFWSLGSGWGTFEKTNTSSTIEICEGMLELKEISIPYAEKITAIEVDGHKVDFNYEKGKVNFETSLIINKSIIINI